MIKLNNKNITYVALADSNNSLKAPKEIWYADSSNSVKLVYRRKDALIEGIDYEKYHWLIADTPNGTNIELPLNTANFSFKRIWRDTFNDTLFISNSGQYVYHAVSKNVQIWDIPNAIDTFFGNANRTLNEEIIICSTDENLTIGNEEVLQIDYPPSIIRFRNADRVNNTQYSTSAITTNGIERYIPCKLLKPVPKWLDANGIRRNIGECGMIDLVSGKFYGNVNSVGTFTVENYYERKEWLQGRNGAYIDTNYYPIVGTDIFSVHFRYDGTTRNPDGGEQDAFGVNYTISNKNNFIRAFINASNKLSCSYYEYAGTWPTTNEYSKEWDITNLMIDGSDFKYVANGTDYLFANNGIQQQICPFSLFVFKNNDNVYNQNCYLHGDISSFKITDNSSNAKMNLIPCTLTMDLPASMDANNIARTKGTSGMWDLVSDRFYGNVANSGTFKAVNLAEGVDYEVHDWLVGDGAAYINTLQFISADDELRCSIIPTAANLSNWQYVYGNNPSDNQYTFMCVLLSNNRLHFRHKRGTTGYSVNTRYNIIHSINSVEVNGNPISYTTEDVYVESDRVLILFNAQEQDNDYIFDGYIGNVILSSKLNLIPVKLLRSLPSKYDANGIARQAGECGMYDTVNDVFYGNVASSGTFSVSDDN